MGERTTEAWLPLPKKKRETSNLLIFSPFVDTDVHLVLFARENENDNLNVDEWVYHNDNWKPTQKLLPGFMFGGFIANDYEKNNM